MNDKLDALNSLVSRWRILTSSYVVKSSWFTLRSDSCVGEKEQVIDPYYVIESQDSVHIVVLNDQGEVLLTWQYRHGAQLMSLEFPCGGVEPGETPESAMKRELLEETGYSVRQIFPMGSFYANPARQTNRVHTFLGLGAYRVGDQKLDATESIGYDFFPISELERFIQEETFTQGLHVGSWYKVLQNAPVELRELYAQVGNNLVSALG